MKHTTFCFVCVFGVLVLVLSSFSGTETLTGLDDMMLPDNRLAGGGIEYVPGEQHVQHVPSSSAFKNIPTCNFSLNIKRVSPPSHHVDIWKGAFGRLPGCMSQIPQILPYPHIVKGNRSWLVWHPSR